ncbi:MAG: hypothetical protein IT328_13060 [Caldilineaceae bacterium]|nr:hypothetical protein [Caldilineaceae bacterium]
MNAPILLIEDHPVDVDFDRFLEVAAQSEHDWTVLNEPPPKRDVSE